MRSKLKHLGLIVIISLVPTLIVWLPFFLRIQSFWGIPLQKDGMATIVANYDGPLYLAVAKTLYNEELLANNFSFSLPATYFAAHFPLFPFLIYALSIPFGFPYAMLLGTLLSSILAIFFFNKFIGQYTDKKNALWLTFVFAIFPARWLIIRSVGSPEPLFLAAIIASIYYFQKGKYIFAAVWGIVAQLTKSPAIILFIAYFTAYFFPHIKQLATISLGRWVKSAKIVNFLPLILIPLTLVGIFFFYKFRFNDFFAYFHSGDNIHLFFPPFQIFNYSQPWVGTFWLEEIIFVYLLGLLGLSQLIKHKTGVVAWFVGLFFTSVLFVSHRDIIRYSLPIVPFLMAGFADTLVRKEFKIILAFLILPIYLFSLAYISQNVMPIGNWAPFL